MSNLKQSFPEMDDLKRKLEHQVETMKIQLAEAEKQLESVSTTYRLLQEREALGENFNRLLSSTFTAVNDLRGMTQLDALVKIAKANNNRLKLTSAKNLLLRAGVTKSRKNANNIIFNVIKRSERFRRVAPGEYELLPEQQRLDTPAPLQ